MPTLLKRFLKKIPKVLKFILLSPVYLFYFIFAVTKKAVKSIRFWKLLGIVAVLAYIGYLNVRLVNVEKRFGGEKLLKCSPEEIRKVMDERVVRIEGSLAEGSGFPISENQIFTNFHVIDGDASPKVVFPDGSIETPVSILGSKDKDMAVLKLNRKLTPLSFYGYMGTSATDPKLVFGEPLYAAGFAMGSDLKGGVTINRGQYNGTRYEDSIKISLIQTDATIVPGMSGGPLVNACGQVVGVNTQGVAGLSMFLDMTSVQNSMGDMTKEEVAKIKVDTSTPEGVVNAFYTYIGARDLKKAYELVDPSWLNGRKYEDWIKGYATTLQVGLISTKPDIQNKNKIEVKLYAEDWVNGTIVLKYFEGYWTVGENLKLSGASIKEVENPGWDWFYETTP